MNLVSDRCTWSIDILGPLVSDTCTIYHVPGTQQTAAGHLKARERPAQAQHSQERITTPRDPRGDYRTRYGNIVTRQTAKSNDRARAVPVASARARTAPPVAAVRLKKIDCNPESLKDVGGSRCDDWNNTLLDQVVDSIWLRRGRWDEPALSRQVTAVANALVGIGPQSELEGMAAAQLIASHNAAMECYRRAMLPETPAEGRQTNLAQAGKLSRTFATLMEALNRHRGKGQQKVTVEHVHVHSGGQAIVGPVQHGGRSEGETGEQPHAKGIGSTPGQTLSGDVEAFEAAVQVTSR